MNETEYKGILHKEVNKLASINPRFHRIASMLLDHIIMTFVIVPPWGLLMITMASGIMTFDDQILRIGFLSMFFIYLNKDFYKAKSPAKRLLGYQVINRKNEKPATELQCFIRNLTLCVAWPLEVIVGLLNPERRIGDFIANTKVVASEKEKLITIWTDIKNTNLKLNFIGIVIIGGIYLYGLSLLMPNMN